MNVAGTKFAAFQVAELVEYEQRMIPGAGKVPNVGGAFLIAVSRAVAGIHVEHDGLGRMPGSYPVNPLPRQISQCGEVLVGGKKTPSLSAPSGWSRRPASQRRGRRQSIASLGTSQTVGVVHVVVATEAAEHRLTKQSRHRVLAVFACARVDELIAHHVRQPKRVIEFTVGNQSAVDGDPGTVELKLRAAVEIEPQRTIN